MLYDEKMRKEIISKHYKWCIKNIKETTYTKDTLVTIERNNAGAGGPEFMWYTGALIHRDMWPAFVTHSSTAWYCNHELHRIDGPAVITTYSVEWYFYGQKINAKSLNEFHRMIVDGI